MIDCVQERLPLLSRMNTRSPGWTKVCILRAMLTWSWPALVRESEAITRPYSGPDPDAVGHGAPAPLRGPAPILGIRSSMLPEPAAMRLTATPTGITVSHADPHRLRAGLRGAPAHPDAADALRPSRGGARAPAARAASWSSRRSRSRASSTGSATAARAHPGAGRDPADPLRQRRRRTAGAPSPRSRGCALVPVRGAAPESLSLSAREPLLRGGPDDRTSPGTSSARRRRPGSGCRRWWTGCTST